MLRKLIVAVVALAIVAVGCTDDGGTASTSTTTSTTTTVKPTTTSTPPPTASHVFVINLENESADQTWGPDTPIPYLANDLRQRGLYLPNYYGVAHLSLGNYIAQISGQGPNKSTQGDCTTYSEFVQTGTAQYDQAVGDGCVYPTGVKTIGDQLADASKTWKSYQEDMSATGVATCRHPALGAVDDTLVARKGDGYATRHNPFVYFHSIIDGPACNNVVDLSALETDLAKEATTPNLAYITPNLCNDGHDERCADGVAGGMTVANSWLGTWVPKILASAAFQTGGMLIITFDEAESSGDHADASGCCGITSTPNAANPGGTGPGGGKVGALVLAKGGRAEVDDTPYNHYSLLCTLEETFGLPKLGYAGHPETKCFAPKGGGGSGLVP